MHRLTATDTPMVRYTRTIFPSYAINIYLLLYSNDFYINCNNINDNDYNVFDLTSNLVTLL